MEEFLTIRRIKMKNIKPLVGIIILSLLVFSAAVAQPDAAALKGGLLVGGASDAPIRIEIFSCYQCPPCRDFYLDTVRPLLKEYARTNKVSVIYYEYPLKIHNHSRDTARYGIAAHRLGQDQWQRVSEALYLKQAQWIADGNVEAVVVEVLSTDEMARVKQFLKDPSIEQTIDRDIQIGNKRQIPGTPTFFLYAKGREERVAGKISYPLLKSYLDRMLK
jgi:protein-disulfide isomerase